MDFGTLKDKFNSLFLNENEELKKDNSSYRDYIELLKTSPILKNEFYVYKTLESTKFKDKDVAKLFLSKLLEPFKEFTVNDVNNEHSKLKNVLPSNNYNVDETKHVFFKSIDNLILASTKDGIYKPEINNNFEDSINVVIHNITDGNVLEKDDVDNLKIEELGYEINSDELYETSVDLFNSEYSDELNEQQIEFLNEILSVEKEGEPVLFERIKKYVIDKLAEDVTSDKQMIDECILTVTRMKYNESNFNDDSTNLLELV